MTARTAPISKIRASHDIVAALPTWPVGRQARQFGVADDVLAGFYLPHVIVAHAIHATLAGEIDGAYELLLFGDAHRAQNMPLFAAPGCTALVLQHLLAAPTLNRVRLVTPSPSIVPELDPSVRRIFPSLTPDGVEVRPLRHAALADSPDAFVLLPTTDPLDFELERKEHAFWRHLADRVAIVGISNTRAEALVLAAYFELFGVTVTEPIGLPLNARATRADTQTLAYAWQVVARVIDRMPTHQQLERFGRLVDLLREDDAFPEDLLGVCLTDPSGGPDVQLVHGHWINIEQGTIQYVAGVDELLEAHEPPLPQAVSAVVPKDLLAQRPAATAPLLDRWYWALEAFDQARSFAATPFSFLAPLPRRLTP